MICTYCGAENDEHQLRCNLCQRRLHLAAPQARPESFGNARAAAAPQLAETPEPMLRRPHVVAENPTARKPVERQQSLFAHGLGLAVESIRKPARQKSAAKSLDRPAASRSRRTPDPNQGVLIDVAPVAPRKSTFVREMDSAKIPFGVAPLMLRSAAASLDAMIILALSGLFLIAFHFAAQNFLGLTLITSASIKLALVPVLAIAFLYKFYFVWQNRPTYAHALLGLQLVSFDGDPPTTGQRMMRFFTGWISFGAGALGLLWAIGDPETLTWHDHVSQTALTTSAQLAQRA